MNKAIKLFHWINILFNYTGNYRSCTIFVNLAWCDIHMHFISTLRELHVKKKLIKFRWQSCDCFACVLEKNISYVCRAIGLLNSIMYSYYIIRSTIWPKGTNKDVTLIWTWFMILKTKLLWPSLETFLCTKMEIRLSIFMTTARYVILLYSQRSRQQIY